MFSTEPLSLTHDEFVSSSIEVIRDALGHDKLSNKRTASNMTTAVETRYVLGGDDNTYLQAGLSLLHIPSAEKKLALAPAALYSIDALKGIELGIEQAAAMRRKKMFQKKDMELVYVCEWLLKTIFNEESGKILHLIIDYLTTFSNCGYSSSSAWDPSSAKQLVQNEQHPLLALVLKAFAQVKDDGNETQGAALLLATHPELPDLFNALLAALDPTRDGLFESIYKSMQSVPKDHLDLISEEARRLREEFNDTETWLAAAAAEAAASFPDGGMKPAVEASSSADGGGPSGVTPEESSKSIKDRVALFEAAIQGTSSSFIPYVISRGLCTKRGPHEHMPMGTSEDSDDDILTYDVPKFMAEALDGVDIDHILKEKVTPAHTRFDARYVKQAKAALNGNFAIDECERADDVQNSKAVVMATSREVRWLPTGDHAETIAEVAALEHAAHRCSRVAKQNKSLFPESRKVLLGTAFALKVKQLSPMYKLSCAMQRGELPSLGSGDRPLVNRPAAAINRKVALPHSGPLIPTEYVVDTGEDTSTVDERSIISSVKVDSDTGSRTYAAHSALCMNFKPAPVGAVLSTDPPMRPSPDVDSNRLDTSDFVQLLNYGLMYANLSASQDPPQSARSTPNESSLGTAEGRRSGLWNEFKRELAISTDRVWTFVRTLSGLIGEDADALMVAADDAALRAAQQIEKQRRDIAEKVTQFHAKLVEIIMTSLLKESKLQVTTSADGQDAADSLVVMNGETAKQIRELSSGESGRPFFEANVALRALTDDASSQPKSLSDTVKSFTEVVSTLHHSLDAELQRPEIAGASLAELAAPRNSYFVRLRDDTAAAIRNSFDKFSTEFRIRGGRHVYLWELVEGRDHMLSSRFAEFVGHQLVQNRMSTGSSAMYASRMQIELTASQSGMALAKLVNQATKYASTTSAPAFTAAVDRNSYFTNGKASDAVNWASGMMHRGGGSFRALMYNKGIWVGGVSR